FGKALGREYHFSELLSRPDVSYEGLMSLPGHGGGISEPAVIEQLEIQAKYSGYIDRQRDEIERQRRHMETRIPDDFEYALVNGLSNEVAEKLAHRRPETMGQASRIPGVTPAAVSLLLVYLKKFRSSVKVAKNSA
ncbi:MAG: tRNA uridine-5-carboxymethylaminomethyl(34) synthesis enzyme MnmG, partial [Gammaproteobacteria bacterium]|nr:tRNA uridine-5-carboxymethylaminomethyl(34) synthesis enzyme MnmG [Gammaproteobacteria bacterium]